MVVVVRATGRGSGGSVCAAAGRSTCQHWLARAASQSRRRTAPDTGTTGKSHSSTSRRTPTQQVGTVQQENNICGYSAFVF